MKPLSPFNSGSFASLLKQSLVAVLFALSVACLTVTAQTVSVVSWNVESGGSDEQTIRQRMASFQGVDLWGLSEVASIAAAGVFETGAEDGEEANFERIVGTTGGGDRLAIIFNADRFRLVRSQELLHINQGNHRAPLLAELQEVEAALGPSRGTVQDSQIGIDCVHRVHLRHG